MSQLGQKEAVIQEVLAQLPSFQKYQDNAILMLSAAQLEAVKAAVTTMILSGAVEYSKSLAITSEVRTYARSMVMNHLKKAKELNGGHSYVASSNKNEPKTIRVKEKVNPKGINLDLLPEELKAFAKSLV